MTRIDRRTLLIAAGAAALPPAARAQAAWEPRAPLPWPVQEIYAAVWNGRIVTAGGLVGRTNAPLHIEDRVGVYDPVADVWSEGPRLPQARHHPMIVADGDRLLAIGGYRRDPGEGGGDWTNATEVWSLTPGAETWAAGPALPTPLAESVGLAHAGRAHLVTGRSPGAEANAQWRDQLDGDAHWVLTDGNWERARPAPMARNSAAGAVLDGALWIAGGRTVSGGGTGRLDRYDPAADRWDSLAPIPRSATADQQVGGGLAMAAVGGKLVAFGGEWFAPRSGGGGGGGVFRETWIYDPATDAWSAGPDMRTPRHGLAAAVVGDTVYAIAGGAVVSGGQAVGTVEALTL
jgi:N-acetylneuraminic acid mutarotase